MGGAGRWGRLSTPCYGTGRAAVTDCGPGDDRCDEMGGFRVQEVGWRGRATDSYLAGREAGCEAQLWGVFGCQGGGRRCAVLAWRDGWSDIGTLGGMAWSRARRFLAAGAQRGGLAWID